MGVVARLRLRQKTSRQNPTPSRRWMSGGLNTSLLEGTFQFGFTLTRMKSLAGGLLLSSSMRRGDFKLIEFHEDNRAVLYPACDKERTGTRCPDRRSTEVSEFGLPHFFHFLRAENPVYPGFLQPTMTLQSSRFTPCPMTGSAAGRVRVRGCRPWRRGHGEAGTNSTAGR